MDQIATKSLDAILTQSGAIGACLVLALIACGFLFKRLTDSEKQRHILSTEYATKLEEMHERRVTELRGSVVALEQSTRAITALEVSMESRTAAFSEVATGFTLLSQMLRSFMESTRDQANRLERDIDEMKRDLRERGR